MESQILQTLEEIRGILFVIAMLLGIGVLSWVLKSISVVVNQFKYAWSQRWKDNANDLYSKGEYEKLVEHCNDRLNEMPNDAHAVWWLARSYIELEDYEEAKKLFIKVGQIEPSWKSEYVDPYLIDGEVLGSPANKGN